MIRNNAVQKFDEEQQMAFAVLEDQWAEYPNRKSMQAKVGYHILCCRGVTVIEYLFGTEGATHRPVSSKMHGCRLSENM